jgi:hypothetical protein
MTGSIGAGQANGRGALSPEGSGPTVLSAYSIIRLTSGRHGSERLSEPIFKQMPSDSGTYGSERLEPT